MEIHIIFKCRTRGHEYIYIYIYILINYELYKLLIKIYVHNYVSVFLVERCFS